MSATKTDWLRSAPPGATNAKAETPLFPFLFKLLRGDDLTPAEASDLFRALLDPAANPAQMAGALTALTAKGETSEELAGMAEVMREAAIRIKAAKKDVVDISGTGSSTAKTFNVSTAAALVAAGAGANVAKQSNRGISSRSGSADALAELGVKIAGDAPAAEATLSGAGLCFLLAPKFHPQLRRIGDLRSSLGIRTCLNVLGLLSNPARVSRHVIGVWHPSLVAVTANALKLLEADTAWVVHGEDGLDEITISGKTMVAVVKDGTVRTAFLTPKDFGLKQGSIERLHTTNAKESAEIIRDVLASRRRDEARSLVVMNAAAALMAAGLAKDPMHAARLAEQSIDSGQAQYKLERLVQITNKK